MLNQAKDFYNESEDLYKILVHLASSDLNTKTLFKNWTFKDIIRHLYVWNYAANLSLLDDDSWKNFSTKINEHINTGKELKKFEINLLEGIEEKALLKLWKNSYELLYENFKNENPKRRIKWVGPDMSVISSISARHMETWAHGQAIYDALKIKRINKDSIINIVIIGNNTFKWSYLVNNNKVPIETPFLKLVSPSGKIWEFNNRKNSNKIEGLAEDFCKVVTQVRNIKDVNLKLEGDIAKEWMAIAQCFAGKANRPPDPGVRKIL